MLTVAPIGKTKLATSSSTPKCSSTRSIVTGKVSGLTVIDTDKDGNPILSDNGKPITSIQYVYQPSLLHFAHISNINKDTLTTYRNKYPVAYKRLKGASELWLQTQLSNPKANTVGTIFALKNNHGWKDKVEIETNHTQTHQLEGIRTEELRALIANTENVEADLIE